MNFSRKISIAPMMDYTDRHCRYFLRLLSKNILLYTEMVTTQALLHGDRERFLRFDVTEHPIVVQLGGSDPKALAECAKISEDAGYDEVNLNVGCPSDRVQSGRFGACLMAEPDLVAESVAAMIESVSIPVTVKTRIGIDNSDEYAFLQTFIEKVAAVGCEVFVVHARKAWLQGLSPKENRDVPPLNYYRVYQLKEDFPQLSISINGGILTLDEAEKQLQKVDGVMIGRAAYHDPYILAEVDQRVFGSTEPVKKRRQVVQELLPYVERELHRDARLNHITRHILGLFNGQPGARAWRRYLSENAHKPGAGPEVIEAALNLVSAD